MTTTQQAQQIRGKDYSPFQPMTVHHWRSQDVELIDRHWDFRPGLSFSKIDASGRGVMHESKLLGSSFCQFVFLAEGDLSLLIPELGEKRLTPNTWFITSTGDLPVQFIGNPKISLFSIACDRNIFNSLGLSSIDDNDTRLECLLCSHRAEPFFLQAESFGRLKLISDYITFIDVESAPGRLMVEAKILEWLATLLKEPELTLKPDCNYICSKVEESALHKAAEFLEQHVSEEHSLVELSRRVHLNEFKLKQGFRYLFNTTVFRYLRDLRMDKAETLLRGSDQSVIEVANAVGYANPSHFARAFKDRFGLLPKAYQKKYR